MRSFYWLLIAPLSGLTLATWFLVPKAEATGTIAPGVNIPAQANTAPNYQPTASCTDNDGDGYGIGCTKGPDCNDFDASVNPGATEVCNNRDDNCNGLVDDSSSCKEPTRDNSAVKVPEGKFLMGSPKGKGAIDEQPAHTVTVKAFSIDRYEVTNARYRACVDAGACTKPTLLSSAKRENYFANPAFDDYPVVFVDWNQADTFCRWEGGRLPTEAEWEKTARGPSLEERTYPWGNNEPNCNLANLGGKQSCIGDTDKTGRRPAGQSPYGAHDMAGNVWEWTSDWYDMTYYKRSQSVNPQGPEQGTLKVMRGGCWASGQDSLRVSCRKAELPSSWAPNVGFRCVKGGK